MRTYQSNTKDKKSRRIKSNAWYAIALVVTVVAIATIITLSLTLGNKPPVDQTPDPNPDPGQNVVVPPITHDFGLPMSDFTVTKLAVLDRLVYSSSMNQWRTHNGVDFSGEKGSAVMAIADGKVLSVVHSQLDATVITIEHSDGFVSVYKGLDTNVLVEEGDNVKLGDNIGSIAAVMPRERSEGPHLHLELLKDGSFIDALEYLPEIGDK